MRAATKVLITGGAGFIGSNLARLLVNSGHHEVTILDDFFTGRRANLSDLDVEVLEGTVADTDLVRKAVRGKDIVFHLAARNVIVSNAHPYSDIETNIIGTYKVFEESLRAGVSRVVYASTASVYGNSKYLPASEEHPVQFLNNYAVSKFAGEAYASCFWERDELPVTTVRYSNVFGYHQYPDNPYSGVIGKFIGRALDNQPLMIHGDGEQTRDFTFVDDACEATLLAATAPRGIGEVYNIGTGVETTVKALAQHIIRLTDSASETHHTEMRDIDTVRRRAVNVEKARVELRHFPRYRLDQGLGLTIEWERSRRLVTA